MIIGYINIEFSVNLEYADSDLWIFHSDFKRGPCF